MMRAIGPPFTPDELAAFVSAARSCMDVPFRHQGRSKRGLDCAGLFAYAVDAIGKPYYNVAAYSREPHNNGLRLAVVENLGPAIPRAQMRHGDIALMTFVGEPCHVGIITDYPLGGFALLHTFAQVKKVVEHRMDAEWLGRIVEVYRP
jgi:hypothetical protein